MVIRLPASNAVADDVNTLGSFLARIDLPELSRSAVRARLGSDTADCLVLLGNSVVDTAEAAFRSVAEHGLAETLLIAGGLGHSTGLLREALANHPRYETVATAARSEASMLADVAVKHWGIDPSRILTETASTNCGENALFSRRALEAGARRIQTAILVQDPTMQRRSHAAFEHVWRDAPVTFLSCPTFVPIVRSDGEQLSFENRGMAGLWPMERFVSLILGEIPRLRDDERGYGPKGRGFIAHVDVPDGVLAAFSRLAAHCHGLIGDRQFA
jgi:uncharacterized SAM-binding protein YcdF (DUF218 family)